MTKKEAAKAIAAVEAAVEAYDVVRQQDPSAIGKERTANYAAEYAAFCAAARAAREALVACCKANMEQADQFGCEWVIEVKELVVARVTLRPGSASFYGPGLCAASAEADRWKAAIARADAHEECWNR